MVESVIPPVIWNETFELFHYTQANLKVPVGSLIAYQTAKGWKEFANIQESSSLSVENTVVHWDNVYIPIYNLQGVEMKNTENLPNGIYIQGGKKFVVN